MTTTIRMNDVGTILEYTVIDETNAVQNISSVTVQRITFFKPDGTTIVRNTTFSTDGSDGKVRYVLATGDIDQQGLWKYEVYIESPSGKWTSVRYNFIVEDSSYSNLVYLIPYLRLKIGDTNSSSYRYTDEWLVIALVASVRALARYWHEKYIVLESGDVSRNALVSSFDNASPPMIEYRDEMPIIVMAAIITLEGSLENSAWNLASWKDAEISVSNQETSRTRNSNLDRLWNELNSYLTVPTKRLAWAKKNSLPGFKNNSNEYEGKY